LYSDELLKKYFKYFILTVSVTVLLLGFLWLNFLYTRHQRSLEDLAQSIGESLQDEVEQKAHLLRLRGESIYHQARSDIEMDLVNRGAILRVGIHDVLFDSSGDAQQREKEISSIVKNITFQDTYEVYLSLKDLTLGNPLKQTESLKEGVNELGTHLVYYAISPSLNLEFYVYTKHDDFIKKRMVENFQDFILRDTGMYIRSEEGEPILPLQQSASGEEGFSFEEYSPETGFHFGYFISESQLEERIEEQRDLFSLFLRSHIWEVVAFLFIFVITSTVIYKMIIHRMADYYTALNEEILEAYRNKHLLSDNPRFQYFALGDSFDSILRESETHEKGDKEKIKSLKEELKKGKLERLLLERKIMRLSELPYTKTNLPHYTMESFSPKELISEVHRRIDPEASMLIRGSDGLLINDMGLFKALVEEVFQLTREDDRSYTVEILRDSGQMLLFFSLHGLNHIEDKKMQELKKRAELLDGVFQRHQMEAHTLHLVLSLSDA
jgi:F0F1-type ATP synthase membrane subunit b/b'